MQAQFSSSEIISMYHSKMIETWKTRLTAARKAKGLNKGEFAARVGVSNASVTDWEKPFDRGGIKNLASNNLDKVTKALDISVDMLLHGRETQLSSLTVDANTNTIIALLADLRPEERAEVRAKIEGFVDGVRSVRDRKEGDIQLPSNFTERRTRRA